MPHAPKIFLNKTLILITARVEEGLPFVPNEYTDALLTNCLARAQTMYPVTIVSYVIMENHIHLLVVVNDPADVPDFMEYFKRESAFCVNRLLGRRKHTVWCEGYDNPVILDPETAINKLKYLYLNPVSAGLVRSGKLWRTSSAAWVSQVEEVSEIKVRRIPRDKIRKLVDKDLSLRDIERLCSEIEYRGSETYTLRVEPNAWMQCYPETTMRDPKELNQILQTEIEKEEARIIREKKDQFPSLTKLQTRSIRRDYTPSKFGQRMQCLGKDKKTRLPYLRWLYDIYRELPRHLRKISQDLIYLAHYPPGFFAPGGFLSANLNPRFTPIGQFA